MGDIAVLALEQDVLERCGTSWYKYLWLENYVLSLVTGGVDFIRLRKILSPMLSCAG